MTDTSFITEILYSDDSQAFAVQKNEDGSYDVLAHGEVRHAQCRAEDVMRALGHYLQNLVFLQDKHTKRSTEE